MNKVRDRQTYRWQENEINNANRVQWLEEIWLDDFTSYLEKNLGIDGSEFESKTYRSKKIYEPEAIDVKVIESKVVSRKEQVENWFEAKSPNRERPKNIRVKIQDKSNGKKFLKSGWQKLKGAAIALTSKAKKALAFVSK